jgi:hypothetical protein
VRFTGFHAVLVQAIHEAITALNFVNATTTIKQVDCQYISSDLIVAQVVGFITVGSAERRFCQTFVLKKSVSLRILFALIRASLGYRQRPPLLFCQIIFFCPLIPTG